MNLGQILNESWNFVLEDALNEVSEKGALEGSFLKGLEGCLEAFEGDLEGALEAASEGSFEDVLEMAAFQRRGK